MAPPPDAPRSALERALPAAALAGAAALGAAFFLHARFFNDDALITLRCAEHLAGGEGLVYNAGERVLGVTTPLWALVLAGAVALGIDGMTAATVLGIAAFGWTAAASVLLVRARGAALPAQALAAALVGTSPLLVTWAGAGMETAWYVASIVTLLWLLETRRVAVAGLLAGAMTLLRPDALLVVAACAIVEIGRARSIRPVLRALPGFGVVVLPWIVGATLYYGSPLPNSGFAKRLQVDDWGTFASAFGDMSWGAGPALPAALVGLVAGLARWERAAPAASFVAYSAGMLLGGMPGCWWYLPPALVLLLLLAAEGAALAAAAIASKPVAFAILAGPLLANVHLARQAHDMRVAQAQVERCHGKVGAWLRDHAPRGASVGVDNIGWIGHRSGLRVVDMAGLVQAGTRERIAAGERDFALRHHRPELIACWVGRGATWKYVPPRAWFDAEGYRVVFEAPLWDGRATPAYTVFSRVPLPTGVVK